MHLALYRAVGGGGAWVRYLHKLYRNPFVDSKIRVSEPVWSNFLFDVISNFQKSYISNPFTLSLLLPVSACIR